MASLKEALAGLRRESRKAEDELSTREFKLQLEVESSEKYRAFVDSLNRMTDADMKRELRRA